MFGRTIWISATILGLVGLAPIASAQFRNGPRYGGPVYGGGPSYYAGAYAQPYFGPQLTGAGFGPAYIGFYPQYSGFASNPPMVTGGGFVAPSGMMMVFPPPPTAGTSPGRIQTTPGTTPAGPAEGSRSAPANGQPQPGPSNGVQPAVGRSYFTINLPAGAKLWVDGVETKMTGSSRRFLTPPNLDPLRTYEYDFRAQWTQAGETVTRDKSVRFRAGDDLPVDFNQTAAR